MNPTHIELIAQAVQVSGKQVNSTIRLLEEGATVPFISRYRKEMTGSLDEVQIGQIQEQLGRLKELEKRKTTILATIEEQGQLTPELKQQIEETYDAAALEDLYLPYKPKRKTRATIAVAKGLEPLAKIIMKQQEPAIEQRARQFLNAEVKDVEEALQGARDIIAEWVNESQAARDRIRRLFQKEATIRSKVSRGKKEEAIKYQDYYDWEEPLRRCPSHRMLAMRRGETEGLLSLSIQPPEEHAIQGLERIFVKGHGSVAQQVKEAVKDGYKRLLQSSIETEFRKLSKEQADEEAIKVFALNLRQLLLAPPLGPKRTLAIDPGFRTGCKVVCLDEQGNLLKNATIYPHPPQQQVSEAQKTIRQLVETYQIEAIAIGNGTASRETETIVRDMSFDTDLPIFVVSEDGASIYSASEIAREEFPDHDVTVRGAISIGRRLIDPLAELVKLDPKSIGVGQYQHDVDQKALQASLDRVVESCVNTVGVDLNTASKHLLTYISGLGPQLAQFIVDYRAAHGAFQDRESLKQVKRMGEKAFEQAAGFLRIRGGKHPLDNTAVHPEQYGLVKKMAQDLGCTVAELIASPEQQKRINLQSYVTPSVGLPTLKDILQELAKPGRDPREKIKTFAFAEGVHSVDDLREGMILPGKVTNITNFGVFVNIGIKQDGLVHISQLSDTFVKSPADIVNLHQVVNVKVTGIDLARNRIQLSMKGIAQE